MSTNYDIGIGIICFHLLLIDRLMLLTGLKLFDYRMIMESVTLLEFFARYSVQGKGDLNQLPPRGDCLSRTSLQSFPHVPLPDNSNGSI